MIVRFIFLESKCPFLPMGVMLPLSVFTVTYYEGRFGGRPSDGPLVTQVKGVREAIEKAISKKASEVASKKLSEKKEKLNQKLGKKKAEEA